MTTQSIHTTASLSLLVALAAACQSGAPPEPESRKAGSVDPVRTAAAATQTATAAKTAPPPEPPPAPTARKIPAKPVAQVPVSEGDPAKGKFSLEDATKGLAGQ